MDVPQPVESVVRNQKTGQKAHLRVSNAGFAAVFELLIGKRRIGYANCAALSDMDYMLSDLMIEEQHQPQGFLRMLRKPLKHRRNGWGTLLLEAVIDEAQACGFRRIYAEVTPTGLQENPALLAWYEKHGFRRSKRAASQPGWLCLERRLNNAASPDKRKFAAGNHIY
ncbi:GNAT family N-acetyltransferase (plasmid) [Deinococcus taeanensis]|uniref:GNAT family N-acetyltransferase n=1 Tax=Deinococcus taeanensis TaxID=2737050 RepID=UPI001CDC5F3A|nr:GNAT family N-acetyltransferase [Deinococcus taeanensis]UBV44281.1 GNAT family N-acetyltransferase [Deinococcus taeanensis]